MSLTGIAFQHRLQLAAPSFDKQKKGGVQSTLLFFRIQDFLLRLSRSPFFATISREQIAALSLRTNVNIVSTFKPIHL